MTYAGPFETWATILTVAATAVAGDVLTAGAMRRIGDLDHIRARAGLAGAIRAVISSPMSCLACSPWRSASLAALHPVQCGALARRARQRVPHLPRQRLRRQALSQRERRSPPLVRRPLRLCRRLPALQVVQRCHSRALDALPEKLSIPALCAKAVHKAPSKQDQKSRKRAFELCAARYT